MFFFTPLCPVKLIGQMWSLLLVTIVNFPPSFVLLFFIISPTNKVEGYYSQWCLKRFLLVLYYALFIVCIYELILFSLKSKISYGPGLLMGVRCWNISSSQAISKMLFALVTFGYVSGFSLITVWWSFIGLSILIISVIYIYFVSTLDGDYLYPYHLRWWCSVIALKDPGMEGDI